MAEGIPPKEEVFFGSSEGGVPAASQEGQLSCMLLVNIYDPLQKKGVHPRKEIHKKELGPPKQTRKFVCFHLEIKNILAPYPSGVGTGVGLVGIGVGEGDGGAVSPNGGMQRQYLELEQES